MDSGKKKFRGIFMKKLGKITGLLFGIFALGFFSGCGVYDKIDLEQTKEQIVALTSTKIDLSNIKTALEKNSFYFGELEEVKLEDLETLNINKDYIAKEENQPLLLFQQEKTSEYNKIPLTSYIIVKPLEEHKQRLQEQLDAYYLRLFEQYSLKDNATEEDKKHLKDVMKKEKEGYLIYILSHNNEEVWKQLEESAHPFLLKDIKELSLKEFTSLLSLEEKYIDSFQGVTSNIEKEARYLFILKPKNGKTEQVKKKLDQYMNHLEQEWKEFPEQQKLVQNRMDTEIGSYLIYIISKENEKVLNTIKNAVTKKE